MTLNSEKNKISHLIRLIDDRDEFVSNRVQEQLIKIGEDAIPFLEIAAKTENPKVKSKVSEVIRVIIPIQLQNQFSQLAKSSPKEHLDLEAGVMLLAKFGYPDEDTDGICQTLDQLAAEAFVKIKKNKSPEHAVKALTHFLFIENGFKGNKTNFFDPDNTYFSRMLEKRKGIPITLATLCVFIGNRLGLPVTGVGLPGHYIVKYDSLTEPIYFDPFENGRILSQKDCSMIVENMGYRFEEHHLSAATNRETLARMMNNLIMVYNKTSQLEKVSHLESFIKVINGGPKTPPHSPPLKKL